MKSVLITGGSRGIGLAVTRLLINEYDYVAICARDEDSLNRIKAETPGQIHIFTGDVSNYNFVSQMVNTIISEAGHLDVLINNAGISVVGLFSDTTPDIWQNLLDINLNSVYNTCHCILPHMIHAKQGRIINVSSVWGITGASCEVAYSTSKGAINSFTKALAKELAPSNIAVNAVAFGAIDTTMNEHLSASEKQTLEDEIPYGRMATPDEAAICIKNIIDMPSYFTGEIVKFDGAWI